MAKPYRFHHAMNEQMADRNNGIIMLVKEDGYSQTEVAKMVNLTPGRVSQIIANGKTFSTTTMNGYDANESGK